MKFIEDVFGTFEEKYNHREEDLRIGLYIEMHILKDKLRRFQACIFDSYMIIKLRASSGVLFHP